MNLTNFIKPYNKSKNKNFKPCTKTIIHQLTSCWDKPLQQTINYYPISQLFIDAGNESNNKIHDRYLS